MNQQSTDTYMDSKTLFYIGLTVSLTCLAIGIWIAA